jgi:hypothetical protein
MKTEYSDPLFSHSHGPCHCRDVGTILLAGMEFLSSNVEELVTRTQLKGAQIHKVSIQQTDSAGYGIFATSPISYGDILLEIPFTECISIDRILASPLSIIFDDNPDLLSYPDEILCLGLMSGLHKTPPTCDWSQHLDVIPKTYNLTIFWDEADLASLRGSMLSHLTAMMLKQIQSDWDNLHHPIALNYPELLSSELTIDDYKWALATVYSRAIGLTRHGQYTRCLVPVLDLVNHHPSASTAATGVETFQYNEADDAILFMSTREYATGDECYASYGSYSNSKLLYTYGFILPTDALAPRAIDMWSTLSPTTPYATEKQQLLQSNPLTAQQTYDFTGTLRGGGWISRALVGTIRVIQATGEEMNDLAEALQTNTMVSLRNERATYLSLLELLARKSKQVED